MYQTEGLGHALILHCRKHAFAHKVFLDAEADDQHKQSIAQAVYDRLAAETRR